MTQKRRAHDVLTAFLTQSNMGNREFAQRIQLVRRHPSIPSGPQVSHWRCGRKVPDHDMRIWIEIASEGAVSADIWGPEKARRKQEKQT